MNPLQAIVERIARHQRDHPVGRKSDLELAMDYIATLHDRISDLERRLDVLEKIGLREQFHHSGVNVGFEVQAHEDTRAGYVAPANIAMNTLVGQPEGDILHLICNVKRADVDPDYGFVPKAHADKELHELRAKWKAENKLVGDEE